MARGIINRIDPFSLLCSFCLRGVLLLLLLLFKRKTVELLMHEKVDVTQTYSIAVGSRTPRVDEAPTRSLVDAAYRQSRLSECSPVGNSSLYGGVTDPLNTEQVFNPGNLVSTLDTGRGPLTSSVLLSIDLQVL